MAPGGRTDFEVISTGIGFGQHLRRQFTMDQHRDAAQKGLELYRDKATSGEYDLIILDEAIGASPRASGTCRSSGPLIKNKPTSSYLLITGHDDEKKFHE